MTVTAAAIETSEPISVVRSRRPVGWAGVMAGIFIVAYAVFIATRFVPALSEPDDNGYFAQGSLLAQTGRTWFVAESDAQYVGMHWLLTPDGKYVSRYPPGLAVLIAVVEKVGGWRAAAVVNPVMAVVALVGFYLLCRRLLGAWWAVAGVVILGTMPEYLHHGLGFDSHTGVAFGVIWGLYFVIRWSQEARAWEAAAAGLILGCIPTVRYPDVVMGLGVGLFLLAVGWRKWPHILAAIAGAMVPITALAVRNQMVMGAFWRTGYALTHEQTGFSFAYFREHAIDYVRQLNSTGVGPILAVGVVGMVWMIATRGRRAMGVMLAGMALPMVLLYMAYYWAPQGGGAMTMRFLVPTFSLYVLAGLWALAEMTKSAGAGARTAVVMSVVALQLLWGTGEALQETDRSRGTKDGLARVTDALERVAAEGSVVVGDQNVLQHLDFVRRWKLADASLLQSGGMMGRGGPGGGPDGDEGPDRPSPRQAEKDEKRREKYAGNQGTRERKFEHDLAAWAGGEKVYFVGTEAEMRNIAGRDGMQVVERVELPEPPPAGRGGGRQTMGMRNGPMGGGGFDGMRGGQMVGGRPGGGGGGGPGGGMMGGFGSAKEVVIAEWDVKES